MKMKNKIEEKEEMINLRENKHYLNNLSTHHLVVFAPEFTEEASLRHFR